MGDGRRDEEAKADTLIAQSPPAITSTPTPSPTEVIGGRFSILGLIGVGGMGAVYRARDAELNEVVALKMLRRELVGSPEMLERFRQEVKLARRVTHANVARTYDIGEHEGRKFLTMELVEGESLAQAIAREGAMPIARVAAIAREMCDGLAAAHTAGVVHRDLKPDNVLVGKDGRVVITDFGIAVVRTEGEVVSEALTGTPAYMAPEQVAGGRIDARTDLYAVGAVLYELLTGRRPFSGDDPLVVATARLGRSAPDPRDLRLEIPEGIAAVVRACMAPAREDRPASAADVRRMLDEARVVASHAVAAPPPPATPRAAPRRNEKTVAVLPFQNRGDAGDDYLVDGFFDELLDTLSMAKGIRVRPRTAVIRYKGDERDAREVGREVGTQVVVQGNIRRAGEGVRITVRVVGVDDGFQIFARRWERPASEVLDVAAEASHAIAEALTADEAPEVVQRDHVAADLYLRARWEFNQFSPDASERAVSLIEQALAREPNDPAFLSAYAMALARWWNLHPDATNTRLDQRALAAADRAMVVDPRRPDPYLARALVLKLKSDFVGTAQALKECLARNPDHPEAHEMIGSFRYEMKDVALAERHLHRALELDPQLSMPLAGLAQMNAMLGNWARAETYVNALAVRAASGVQDVLRARFALWKRDRAFAEGRLETLVVDTPLGFMARWLLTAVVGGRLEPRDEALLTRAMAGDVPRRQSYFNQLRAEVADCRGEVDLGIEAIDRAIEKGLIDLLWLDLCPGLATLRADPRFPARRERVVARIEDLRRLFA